MTDPEATPSALITGGGTGIGLATAHVLHRAGYALTLAGRRADVLAAAAAELGGDGPPVRVHVADLADRDAPQAAVDVHVDAYGGIDAVLTGAGNYELTAAVDLDAAAWDATMDVQLRGAVLTATRAAHHMARAGRGRIVLLSSVNGVHSEPETIAYSAAKTAIVSVARTLAVELAPYGVQANAVAPGWVYSPMTAEYLDASTSDQLARVNPLGRAGTAEEIANVVGYLVTDAPDFLTGSTIVVDGGQTAMAPLP